jgi:5-methylthioadenosine/S-adenosylhomocysteine deaminase
MYTVRLLHDCLQYSMQQVDTVINARWIIPVEPEGVVLEHHSLVVNGGRILAVVPSTQVLSSYDARTAVTLDRHVLIPGLINTHTHTPMTLFRGLADDLPLMTWLNEHIWPAEGTWVSPEFVRDGTRHAAAEMLRGGTTCFSDMYFFPDETARIAKQCGIRAVIGLIMIDFPTVWAGDPAEYLEKGLKVHDEYRADSLVRTAFAPHAPYTVSNGPLERIQVLAEELDIPIHMHVHESADEIRQSLANDGARPLARLQQLGLLTPRLMAVHMTQLVDDEIAALAAAGVHVIHCPESNLKLASGYCPVHALSRAGVNVALGTDGAASNNDLDMMGEMHTAALLAKAVAGDASALPAARALRMATLDGARALGLDDSIGSLVPGKAADMAAVDLGDIETQPLYHPVSQLIYSCGRDKVTDVWVDGRHLLRNRELTTVDIDEVRGKAGYWREKIAH